jgi:serine/threonine protein phosphatase PrpC
MPEVDVWGVTHVGRVRKNNEDAFALAPEMSLAIVADGMGGAACGEVASEITVDTIIEYVRNPKEEELPEDQVLKEAIRLANQRVFDTAEDRKDCNGMGSTVVVASWRHGKLWIANVGDSRAYLWRGGELRQLSYDQNLANELRMNLGLTEEQISHYPHRNVLTMAIGTTRDVLVRLQEEQLERGDLVLLCSDGLYGPAGGKITEIIKSGGPLDQMGNQLVQAALEGGGPDNVTVVLVRRASQE